MSKKRMSDMVLCHGKHRVRLGDRAAVVVRALKAADETPVSALDLIALAWPGINYTAGLNRLAVMLSGLRRKAPDTIRNIHGAGWMLRPDVRLESMSTSLAVETATSDVVTRPLKRGTRREHIVRTVIWNEQAQVLGRVASEYFDLLWRNRGRVVLMQDAAALIWDEPENVCRARLAVLVSDMKKKLPGLVHNCHGHGYYIPDAPGLKIQLVPQDKRGRSAYLLIRPPFNWNSPAPLLS